LLVDDEPVVRKVVRLALTRAGYTVLVATDGTEALQVSRAYDRAIDVLLTDYKMPTMNGPDLAAMIAQERPGIRIVLMSGHSSGTVPEVMKRGLLKKPFRPVDEVTRIHKELRDNGSSNGDFGQE
jgi:hypothetical protein